jgi:hypothetical protein
VVRTNGSRGCVILIASATSLLKPGWRGGNCGVRLLAISLVADLGVPLPSRAIAADAQRRDCQEKRAGGWIPAAGSFAGVISS